LGVVVRLIQEHLTFREMTGATLFFPQSPQRLEEVGVILKPLHAEVETVDQVEVHQNIMGATQVV